MQLTGGINTAAIANTATQTGDSVTNHVLKKALDSEAQTAAALLRSVPQPTPTDRLPDNLGRNLNVVA